MKSKKLQKTKKELNKLSGKSTLSIIMVYNGCKICSGHSVEINNKITELMMGDRNLKVFENI